MVNEKLLKLLNLLTSRKFLAAVAALLVVFEVIPEGAEGGIVEAVLTVVVAVGYIIGVAIEDAGSGGTEVTVEESAVG